MAEHFDDLQPHDPKRSSAQIRGLTLALANSRKRVLDLGCGSGRTLIPLARAGHDVTGVDLSTDALAACKAQYPSAQLIHADFRYVELNGGFDAVLCLGNTFMTVADVDDAARFVERVATWLKPGAAFFIDDFPYEFWLELTDGNWQSGVSEDGSMQMVWKPGDAVFALRKGHDVDSGESNFLSTDVPLRLWCEGSLRLLAKSAGLSPPIHLPQFGLMRMDRGLKT